MPNKKLSNSLPGLDINIEGNLSLNSLEGQVDLIEGTGIQVNTDAGRNEIEVVNTDTGSSAISTHESSFTHVTFTPEDSANKGQNNGYASLDSGGKIPVAQLPASLMEYKGTWNATTNDPALTDGTGTNGDVYLVSVGGTRNLGSGDITFSAGDWVVYNGTIWQRSINSNLVMSVNEQTGVVSLDASNIPFDPETSNLTAIDVQGAIDELEGIVDGLPLDDYVLKAGDTMTGPLAINADNATFSVTRADAGNNFIDFNRTGAGGYRFHAASASNNFASWRVSGPDGSNVSMRGFRSSNGLSGETWATGGGIDSQGAGVEFNHDTQDMAIYANNILVRAPLHMRLNDPIYYRGDADTDGSVRISSPSASTILIEQRTGGVWEEIELGGGAVTDHSTLAGRDAAESHPISAISTTGLAVDDMTGGGVVISQGTTFAAISPTPTGGGMWALTDLINANGTVVSSPVLGNTIIARTGGNVFFETLGQPSFTLDYRARWTEHDPIEMEDTQQTFSVETFLNPLSLTEARYIVKFDSTTRFSIGNEGNIYLTGSLQFGSGQAVDTIETTLTDDDTHLPTSGAVYNAIDGVTGVEYVTAPATPTSTGTQGQFAYSGNYLYVCVATDTWIRTSAESTWS